MEHSLEQGDNRVDMVRTDEISRDERLVLYVFRRWVCGVAARDPGQWEMAWRELAASLGTAEARRVLGGLEWLLRATAAYAHRHVNYHPPCCGLLGPDEEAMLQLMAAAQQDDLLAVESVARTFVSDAGIGSVVAAARNMAQALSTAGLALPWRWHHQADPLTHHDAQPKARRQLH